MAPGFECLDGQLTEPPATVGRGLDEMQVVEGISKLELKSVIWGVSSLR